MTLQKAILATLAYHDIFDYPLTAEEVGQYLVGKYASARSIKPALSELTKNKQVILERSDRILTLYALKGRKKIFAMRKKRQKYSIQKLQRAKFYANLLKLIPSVKMTAVSGALAMQNSHKGDDIDLVVVTSKGLLWTTRLLTNLILLPFKRDPHGKKVADRACLNLFLDESALKISDQNLYTAHELAQLKLLWDREGTYQKLIRSNAWIGKYLSNWKVDERLTTKNKRKKGISALDFSRLALVVEPLEALAKWGQLSYMRSKITTEKIGDKQLFFHPHQTSEIILRKYQRELKRTGLLGND